MHDKGTGPNIKEDSGGAQVPQPQGPRRQGQGRAPPRQTGASRAGRASNTAEGRAVGSRARTSSGSRGQAPHQKGQGTLAATHNLLNQTQSGALSNCSIYPVVGLYVGRGCVVVRQGIFCFEHLSD